MFKEIIINNSFCPDSTESETPIQTPIQNITLNESKELISDNFFFNPNTKIFNVIHKKEIISTNKKSQILKCVYCGYKYTHVHRFIAHLRTHVIINFLIFHLI